MKFNFYLVLEFTNSDHAGPRLQKYLRPMPLEKFPVEIKSLKLDFLFSGFFCKLVWQFIYEYATQMEIDFQRLDFDWDFFFFFFFAATPVAVNQN